jgi:hypothetical protein
METVFSTDQTTEGNGEERGMTQQETDLLKEIDNSPSMALELTTNLIKWLEWVADRDYSEADRQKVIVACHKLMTTLQPIASKYLD